MKKIAFIPIRKGSKGLKNKNLKKLSGKPLLFWTLDTLLQSTRFDEIWIATDSKKAISLVKGKYNDKIYTFKRSRKTATDDSSIMEVIQEFIATKDFKENDWFCLFQATSPFTTTNDIESLINKINSEKYNSIVSCVRLKKFRWTEEGYSIDYSLDKKPRRQEYRGFLIESGNFYSSQIKILKDSPYILSGKVGIVEIRPETAIDIDDKKDWEYAKYIIKKVLNS